MDDRTKKLLGWAGVVVGTALLVGGALAVHFVLLPAEDALGRPIYSWVPRGWVPRVILQLVAFGGSQILMAGVVIGWLWDREMTWARASVGALLLTTEMMLLFGVVPNEWIALYSADFQWTSQKIWITLPPWLMLNNEVSISYGALGQAIGAGFVTTMLVAVLIGVYQAQEFTKRAREPKPQPVSTYGRPLVRGDE